MPLLLLWLQSTVVFGAKFVNVSINSTKIQCHNQTPKNQINSRSDGEFFVCSSASIHSFEIKNVAAAKFVRVHLHGMTVMDI